MAALGDGGTRGAWWFAPIFGGFCRIVLQTRAAAAQPVLLRAGRARCDRDARQEPSGNRALSESDPANVRGRALRVLERPAEFLDAFDAFVRDALHSHE